MINVDWKKFQVNAHNTNTKLTRYYLLDILRNVVIGWHEKSTRSASEVGASLFSPLFTKTMNTTYELETLVSSLIQSLLIHVLTLEDGSSTTWTTSSSGARHEVLSTVDTFVCILEKVSSSTYNNSKRTIRYDLQKIENIRLKQPYFPLPTVVVVQWPTNKKRSNCPERSCWDHNIPIRQVALTRIITWPFLFLFGVASVALGKTVLLLICRRRVFEVAFNCNWLRCDIMPKCIYKWGGGSSRWHEI